MTDATVTLIRSDHGELELARLLERLTEQLLSGEMIDLDTLVAEHPQHAERLAELLPTIRAVAEVGRAVNPLESKLQLAGVKADGIADEIADRTNGRTLGDFRILREIGRGGMGVVYEAEQISLGRRVALKVLPFASMLDERQLQRFKNEARAAATLNHPNIVPVYSVGCERGVHFYAMQYIEGQTLAAVIEALRDEASGVRHQDSEPADARGRVSPRREPESRRDSATCSLNPEPRTLNPPSDTLAAALSTLRETKPRDYYRRIAELGIQAAEALDHAHQLGIVHRDIKPANLLIEAALSPDARRLTPLLEPRTPNPRTTDHRTLNPAKLWIADFGLARLPTDAAMTMTGDLLGTLRYMSPEQALAKRITVDHRTDIYSLGITFYELLALQPAFNGADREQVLRQIAFEEPCALRHRRPSIPVELETIIHKAISKNPDDRYATARDLADDLARFLEDKPIRARRLSLLQKVTKWSRRHRSVVVPTAIAAAVILLAGSGALWYDQQRTKAAYEEERRLRTLGLANLDQAHAAIDRMLTRVAEETLLNQPKMQHLRRSILDDALQLNQALLNQNEDEPVARVHTALAHKRMGNIYRMLGDHAGASKHYSEARDILLALGAEFPEESSYVKELSEVYYEMGYLLYEQRDVRASEAVFRLALDTGRTVKFEGAIPIEHRHRLAKCLNCLGAGMLSGRRFEEAETAFREALALQESMSAGTPDELRYSDNLASVCQNLGLLLLDKARPEEAEPLLQRSMSISEQLARRSPDDADVRSGLAFRLMNWGELLRRMKRIDESEKALRRSVEIREKLVADFPDVPQFRFHLGVSLNNLGYLLEHHERPAEGAELFRRAVAIIEQFASNSPENSGYRRYLRNYLINLGHAMDLAGREDEVKPIYRDLISRFQTRAANSPNMPSESNDSYKAILASLHYELACFLSLRPDFQASEQPEALRFANEAVRLAPKDMEYWKVVGLAHYRTGNWNEAVAVVKKSIELRQPGDALHFFILAAAHWQQGRPDDARLWYDRGVKWMEEKKPQHEALSRFRAETEELLGISTSATKAPEDAEPKTADVAQPK